VEHVRGAGAPDPITEPKAYQGYLLDLLGDDDPATVQETTPVALRTLLAEAGEGVALRPDPGEWSVLGCIAHVTDAELVMGARYRFVLAQDEPPLIGYDQDRWVDRLHGDNPDAEELLALFEPLRRANLALWRRSSHGDRARVGMHAERGPESFDLSFRMIAGHDRFHLAQARRALDAVRS
jgi:hypothetical protein